MPLAVGGAHDYQPVALLVGHALPLPRRAAIAVEGLTLNLRHLWPQLVHRPGEAVGDNGQTDCDSGKHRLPQFWQDCEPSMYEDYAAQNTRYQS